MNYKHIETFTRIYHLKPEISIADESGENLSEGLRRLHSVNNNETEIKKVLSSIDSFVDENQFSVVSITPILGGQSQSMLYANIESSRIDSNITNFSGYGGSVAIGGAGGGYGWGLNYVESLVVVYQKEYDLTLLVEAIEKELSCHAKQAAVEELDKSINEQINELSTTESNIQTEQVQAEIAKLKEQRIQTQNFLNNTYPKNIAIIKGVIETLSKNKAPLVAKALNLAMNRRNLSNVDTGFELK